MSAATIDLKPHRGGWKVFEAPGVEPFSIGDSAQDQAVDYAKHRQRSNKRPIRILDFERQRYRINRAERQSSAVNNIYKEIDDAKTPSELRDIMNRVSPGSPMWVCAEARLKELRHSALRAPPWYRQLAIWISIVRRDSELVVSTPLAEHEWPG